MTHRQLERGGPGSVASPDADDTGCSVLHVDLDAFFASVEVMRRPELRGRPVIVGGTGNRGVVSSASYEARARGVHSAMPVVRARRLCPDAVFVQPDGRAYEQVSRNVMEILRAVTDRVEQISIDEAFLDVRGAGRRLGSPARIAELIRAQVVDEQHVTCSVGVASSKFVAKLASTRAKPDGMLVVPVDRVVEFLHPLPVGALWGVGEKTEEVLARLGLRTVADLAHTPVDTLVRALGPAAGRHLHALSWGRDDRAVVPVEPDRSIGAEETFPRDVDDPEVVHRELLRLATGVATRLRKAGMAGRTITVKVRFADFTTITRSRTLRAPTDVTREIATAAASIFDGLNLQRARLRLVGVRVEHLVEVDSTPRQLELSERAAGWREADAAVDRAAHRFGRGAVRPARLIEGGPGGGEDRWAGPGVTPRPPRPQPEGRTQGRPGRTGPAH